MSDPLSHGYTLVGAGRLARALALALAETGVVSHVIASRSVESASRLAERIDGSEATALDAMRGVSGSLVLISVSDDALDSVVSRLAELRIDWKSCTVLHTSGTWTSEVLEPLARKGATVASFHPVQTFSGEAREGAARELFRTVPVAVEGQDEAVEAAFALARRLGADPFRIDAASKRLFHAAAVMASNYVVTLSALADEMAALATGDDSGMHRYFTMLSRTAVQNVAARGPEASLTGPIVRGDLRVLEAHLSDLGAKMPHLVPIYAALATETVRLAGRSGSLDARTAARMLDRIAEHLDALPAAKAAQAVGSSGKGTNASSTCTGAT